jgi:uncharacterized membrane protein YphA (DoxX/SURF4 family)
MGAMSEVFRFAQRSAGPLVELAIRLWLAQIFLVSGLLKAANWDNALYLSANEYPVAWMNPVAAAYLGVTVELLGAVMLALGVGTRLAAVAMLILSLVIQFNYLALDVHLYLFWAILFGWFFVRGGGAFSFDRLLARGALDTAVPFAGLALRASGWITRVVAPFYKLFLRVWLGAALIVATLIPTAAGEAALWETNPR